MEHLHVLISDRGTPTGLTLTLAVSGGPETDTCSYDDMVHGTSPRLRQRPRNSHRPDLDLGCQWWP